ncbi:uncharacterized protein LOC134726484 [Mytilus trossulus]|uniref:uncharacterized protein LOC134726484 n=1 Tax=Mytilus trossulus TaxID=6551 RepID=UPI0030076FC0
MPWLLIAIFNSRCVNTHNNFLTVDNTSKTSDASVTIATRYTRDGSKEIDTTLISDTSDTSGTVDSSDTTTVDISNVINTGDTSDANDTSDAGMIVGLIIGGLLLACVVIVTIVFIRRHIFKRRPREKIRNNLRENDYIGTQDIALPLTANESGCIQTDGKNTNTAYTVRWNTTVSDNSTLSDHRYSIVDQTPETTLNETKDGKGTTDSYMILDPSATGFNRTKLPNTYEFAKPVIDAENNIGDDDQYALSEEGVYDHSGNNRHKESEVNIYNHAVDTIYDCGSHKRKEEGREDTYDHFFGHKTEDDYDISTTT